MSKDRRPASERGASEGPALKDRSPGVTRGASTSVPFESPPRRVVVDDEDESGGEGNWKKIAIFIALLLMLAALITALVYYYNNREIFIPNVELAQTKTISPPQFLFMFDGGPQAPMDEPLGIAINQRTSRVYVADARNSRVSAFDKLGKYLFSFDSVGKYGKLKIPLFIAIDSQDRVWVTDRRLESIYVFDPDGRFIMKFIANGMPDFEWQPTAIEFDKKGDLYVSDISKIHRVLVFSPSGKLKVKMGKQGLAYKVGDLPGQLAFPNGLAVDDDNGDIWVGDSDNRRLQLFRKNGSFKQIYGTGGNPRGIDWGYEDRMHVVDVMAHNVNVYDKKGRPLVTFGEIGFGEGQLYFPTAVATLERWVYVTDTQNDRVVVWGWKPTVSPPRIAAPACLLGLLLLLLPLLLLFMRRKWVLDEGFMVRTLEDQQLREFRNKIKRARVDRFVYSIFKEVEQEDVLAKKFLKRMEYNIETAHRIEEEYNLDEVTSALLAIAMRGIRKARFLSEDPYSLKVAEKLKLKAMSYEEFWERYGRGAKPQPIPPAIPSGEPAAPSGQAWSDRGDTAEGPEAGPEGEPPEGDT